MVRTRVFRLPLPFLPRRLLSLYLSPILGRTIRHLASEYAPGSSYSYSYSYKPALARRREVTRRTRAAVLIFMCLFTA